MMRVLVVDDDPNIRSALRRLLLFKYHAEVTEAADGSVALQHLLRGTFDLVLLDMHMRTMDGMETLRAIRRSPSHGTTPVIMLTGSSDEDLIKRAIALGVEDYLVKPVDAPLLFARIALVLARHGKNALLDAANA
ncbi:MAG TPA: response regulator [Vicinamibacterales bacterium]|nr:response regulator [Vicinamibacterales bacterium]